jgi:invasion protein IalB
VRAVRIRALGALAAIATAIAPAVAQEGEPFARFQSWDLHILERPEGRTCIVASRPLESLPSNVIRSAITFMITDWPTDGTQNEVHVQMGYPLATDVTVTVDDQATFTMTIVDDEGAWLPTEVEDDLLTDAMKRGRTMVVRARSTRGTDTVDTYSLFGITAALAQAAEECT